MDQKYIVSIKYLNHYFGNGALRKRVLSNINLEVKTGEIVILSGPSGSGKTTLLTLIGGLRSVDEGSLKVLDQEIRGASDAQLIKIRRHIGYIFQSHNLLRSLTAQQNVQMSIKLHENVPILEARRKSAAALEAVGLGNRINYYPENLSGGQKQRVAIARALVCHPKLVLADEPTAALDSKSGRDVVTLMQQLVKEQGCAVLMVTHDNRILDIADRIVHMEDGQLVTINSTAH
ncbi:DevA family ABC transporter ATP-binding protein [Funiculus sociatus GB2-A5]|uniref:DevA family ABC transporter ATP-binding protein n=1 Tax=Funiculus sociatus GB2-A5 TaxID=2933946 RepID=A0ABV0JPC3_9CYAN|nr:MULTISPECIES: DevA family ABC transporter ATP-binding protein [unclassified Trichocoleus]MBD1908579.1 DevA family ABC transporter ATP-binding protein [Trichocoleus sp. FACHB-832]MBD2063911.1 DevA family ABC transporter ATP-binding protein [Trichocoleus sp. FACHB-6]